MLLLDTNVVSELMRRAPAPAVLHFVDSKLLREMFLPSIALAELRYGIQRLPQGRRRDDIETAFASLLEAGFDGRVLAFDSACAEGYAELRARRERAGRPVTVQDALIGGMALAYGATLATRNIADFADTGVDLVDPWREA